MVIREKGSTCLAFPEEFIVFDFETTGKDREKKIVQIGAVKVNNGIIIDSFNSLVNPQMHIPEDATAIHGITDAMVSEAPVISDILKPFMDFIGILPLIGYNIAAFDYNLLYDEAKEHLGQGIHNEYIDVMHMVQRANLPIENRKLATVCEYYHISTSICAVLLVKY